MNTTPKPDGYPSNSKAATPLKRFVSWGIMLLITHEFLPGSSLRADSPVVTSIRDSEHAAWATHRWVDRAFQEDPLRWTYLASPGTEGASSEPGATSSDPGASSAPGETGGVASREQTPDSPFAIDFRERSIAELTTNIHPRSPEVPPDVARGKLQAMADVSYESVLQREWVGLRFCWDAPVFAHQPLYFEEVNLERYGYGPRHLRAVQPLLSGAHFFATIPVLPYHLGATPVHQPVYALGHYRPGSPAPYRFLYPPFSIRGGLAQAGVMVGLIGVIP